MLSGSGADRFAKEERLEIKFLTFLLFFLYSFFPIVLKIVAPSFCYFRGPVQR